MFGDRKRPSATIAAEIDRIIGLNMLRARESARLGQHDVATLLSISVHALARYEEGAERAPPSVLLELTGHLGCQLTDFFAGMPSMELDEGFQGSRVAGTPMTPNASGQAATAHVRDPAPAVPGPAIQGTGRDEAAIAAGIVKAFADLTSPLLRSRLLGLLEVMG